MSREGLAGYRLVEPIGRGAAATVYSAEYGKLRRPVAIKILHPHLVKDGSADRMLAEARTLSLLDHPGIVKVFDVGTARDGRAFMVMEQLVGEPLHERLRRGRLPEDRVLMFGRQLASALEVAHAAGIVHRDLKPENVFVVQDPDLPGGERVKVIDFGIAKSVAPEHPVEETKTGIVLGTPAYMAPERFRGSREIDPRADVYSLGVVIYLMATGKAPFSGRDTDELAAEHEYCRPTSPAAAGVSPKLTEVIDRCLEKRPEDRYGSMAAVGAALRAIEAPSLNGWDDSTTFIWGDGFEAITNPTTPAVPPSLSPATTQPAMPPPPPLARASEPLPRPSLHPSSPLPPPPAVRVLGSQPAPVQPEEDDEDEPAVTSPRAPIQRPVVRNEGHRTRFLLAAGAVLGVVIALVIELSSDEGAERAAEAATTIGGTIDLSGVEQMLHEQPPPPAPAPVIAPEVVPPAPPRPSAPPPRPRPPERAPAPTIAPSQAEPAASPAPAPSPGKAKRTKKKKEKEGSFDSVTPPTLF